MDILEFKPGQTVTAAVKDQLICQSSSTEFSSLSYLFLEEEMARNAGRQGWIRTWNGQLKYLDGDLSDQTLDQKFPEYHFPKPQYLMWSQYCG